METQDSMVRSASVAGAEALLTLNALPGPSRLTHQRDRAMEGHEHAAAVITPASDGEQKQQHTQQVLLQGPDGTVRLVALTGPAHLQLPQQQHQLQLLEYIPGPGGTTYVTTVSASAQQHTQAPGSHPQWQPSSAALPPPPPPPPSSRSGSGGSGDGCVLGKRTHSFMTVAGDMQWQPPQEPELTQQQQPQRPEQGQVKQLPSMTVSPKAAQEVLLTPCVSGVSGSGVGGSQFVTAMATLPDGSQVRLLLEPITASSGSGSGGGGNVMVLSGGGAQQGQVLLCAPQQQKQQQQQQHPAGLPMEQQQQQKQQKQYMQQFMQVHHIPAPTLPPQQQYQPPKQYVQQLPQGDHGASGGASNTMAVGVLPNGGSALIERIPAGPGPSPANASGGGCGGGSGDSSGPIKMPRTTNGIKRVASLSSGVSVSGGVPPHCYPAPHAASLGNVRGVVNGGGSRPSVHLVQDGGGTAGRPVVTTTSALWDSMSGGGPMVVGGRQGGSPVVVGTVKGRGRKTGSRRAPMVDITTPPHITQQFNALLASTSAQRAEATASGATRMRNSATNTALAAMAAGRPTPLPGLAGAAGGSWAGSSTLGLLTAAQAEVAGASQGGAVAYLAGRSVQAFQQQQKFQVPAPTPQQQQLPVGVSGASDGSVVLAQLVVTALGALELLPVEAAGSGPHKQAVARSMLPALANAMVHTPQGSMRMVPVPSEALPSPLPPAGTPQAQPSQQTLVQEQQQQQQPAGGVHATQPQATRPLGGAAPSGPQLHQPPAVVHLPSAHAGSDGGALPLRLSRPLSGGGGTVAAGSADMPPPAGLPTNFMVTSLSDGRKVLIEQIPAPPDPKPDPNPNPSQAPLPQPSMSSSAAAAAHALDGASGTLSHLSSGDIMAALRQPAALTPGGAGNGGGASQATAAAGSAPQQAGANGPLSPRGPHATLGGAPTAGTSSMACTPAGLPASKVASLPQGWLASHLSSARSSSGGGGSGATGLLANPAGAVAATTSNHSGSIAAGSGWATLASDLPASAMRDVEQVRAAAAQKQQQSQHRPPQPQQQGHQDCDGADVAAGVPGGAARAEMGPDKAMDGDSGSSGGQGRDEEVGVMQGGRGGEDKDEEMETIELLEPAVVDEPGADVEPFKSPFEMGDGRGGPNDTSSPTCAGAGRAAAGLPEGTDQTASNDPEPASGAGTTMAAAAAVDASWLKKGGAFESCGSGEAAGPAPATAATATAAATAAAATAAAGGTAQMEWQVPVYCASDESSDPPLHLFTLTGFMSPRLRSQLPDHLLVSEFKAKATEFEIDQLLEEPFMLALAPGSTPSQEKVLRQLCASELCFVALVSSTTHLVVCSQQVEDTLVLVALLMPIGAIATSSTCPSPSPSCSAHVHPRTPHTQPAHAAPPSDTAPVSNSTASAAGRSERLGSGGGAAVVVAEQTHTAAAAGHGSAVLSKEGGLDAPLTFAVHMSMPRGTQLEASLTPRVHLGGTGTSSAQPTALCGTSSLVGTSSGGGSGAGGVGNAPPDVSSRNGPFKRSDGGNCALQESGMGGATWPLLQGSASSARGHDPGNAPLPLSPPSSSPPPHTSQQPHAPGPGAPPGSGRPGAGSGSGGGWAGNAGSGGGAAAAAGFLHSQLSSGRIGSSSLLQPVESLESLCGWLHHAPSSDLPQHMQHAQHGAAAVAAFKGAVWGPAPARACSTAPGGQAGGALHQAGGSGNGGTLPLSPAMPQQPQLQRGQLQRRGSSAAGAAACSSGGGGGGWVPGVMGPPRVASSAAGCEGFARASVGQNVASFTTWSAGAPSQGEHGQGGGDAPDQATVEEQCQAAVSEAGDEQEVR